MCEKNVEKNYNFFLIACTNFARIHTRAHGHIRVGSANVAIVT